MRKIEAKMNKAMRHFLPFSSGNTTVVQKNWAWFLVSNLDNSRRAFFSGMTV